jgi:hypothetical protein
MSGKQRERRIVVRAIRRDPPDLRKLARARIDLAQAQLEAEAEAEHEARLASASAAQESDER